MRTHAVELDGGLTLTVEEEGEGPPFLLLHAGVSERHMWDPQWRWLPSRFRAVRWDWRGYGDTPHVPGPYSYAADVVRVLDALGIERATLMGCSFAGGVEIQVAIEHPDRVERLVVVGTGLPGFEAKEPPEVERLFAQMGDAFAREDVETALGLAERLWLVGPRRSAADVDAGYLGRARELLWRSDRPDNGATFADADWSAIGRLGEIRAPTLVVVGDEDVPGIIEACERLAAEVPNVRFERIAGAAHLPNLERPQAFDAILRDWLGP